MTKFSCCVPCVRQRMSQMVKKPTASVHDLFFKDLSDEGIKFLAKVSVFNPNCVTIPICEISYSLKFASRETVLKGTIPDQGSLKGKKKTILEVPMEVKYSIFKHLVKDIVVDWKIDCQLDLELIIDLPLTPKFTIPLSFQREIKLNTQTLSDIWDKIKTIG